MTEKNRIFLLVAVEEAWKGQGAVEPNPKVGAVIVKEDKIIARGAHKLYGGPHAEINVLKKAGAAAQGATLYVTLEPCSSQGKTPPCTEAVLRAGLGRVVIGAVDPNPVNSGNGIQKLKSAGLRVEVLKEEACDTLLDDFKAHLAGRRPHVILKWAMTLDGRIASHTGNSQWISGDASRRAVHRMRGHVDGVMVGRGTVEIDDPRLNCRARKAPLVPSRIVIDPELKSPASARLFAQAAARADESGHPLGPVLVLASKNAESKKADALKALGVELVMLDSTGDSRKNFLEESLERLRAMGIHRLLVEGGAALFTAFIEARFADQVEAYVAPKVVGGRHALSPVLGEGFSSMGDAIVLEQVATRRIGDDLWIRGFFPWRG